MSEKLLPDVVNNVVNVDEVLTARQEGERLEKIILEKETELNNLRRETLALAYPKNPEAKKQRSLTVPQGSFAEFFDADSADTVIPEEARLIALAANPEAVNVYIRPYGPHGSTLGDASASPERGRPVQLWRKSKYSLAASGDVIGQLTESLWSLNPGDTVYVHSAGKSKHVSCHVISRPNADRTIVAKCVPSRFERSVGRMDSFSAVFVQGAYERSNAISGLKLEIENFEQQKFAAMRPIFEARLQGINERLLALGELGIELTDTGFIDKNYQVEYHYTDFDVDNFENKVTEMVQNKTARQIFEAGFDEKVQARLAAIEAKTKEDNGFLVLFAPKYSQYSLVFGYNPDGLKDLKTFLDEVEIKKAREIIRVKTEREIAEQETKAAEMGLPSNVQIFHRRGGNTKLSDGWVIKPNGELRPANTQVLGRMADGHQVWRQLLPGELALSWSKDYSAAEQVFVIEYLPSKVTTEQVGAVSMIQQELADDRGPGRGWGFSAPAKVTPVVAQVEATLEAVLAPEIAVTVETTTFIYSGKRDFKCDCGCFERVSGGSMNDFNAGKSINITCGSCQKTGVVTKT